VRWPGAGTFHWVADPVRRREAGVGPDRQRIPDTPQRSTVGRDVLGGMGGSSELSGSGGVPTAANNNGAMAVGAGGGDIHTGHDDGYWGAAGHDAWGTSIDDGGALTMGVLVATLGGTGFGQGNSVLGHCDDIRGGNHSAKGGGGLGVANDYGLGFTDDDSNRGLTRMTSTSWSSMPSQARAATHPSSTCRIAGYWARTRATSTTVANPTQMKGESSRRGAASLCARTVTRALPTVTS
jgi:hypothetical protein